MNEIKMRKKKILKAEKEALSTQKKLLITAAVFTCVLILSVAFILTYDGSRLLRPSGIFPNKYVEQASTEPDTREYPENITEKLEKKLRKVSDNTVVKVYIGNEGDFFDLIPIELTKKDILAMANKSSSLSFDLAK